MSALTGIAARPQFARWHEKFAARCVGLVAWYALSERAFGDSCEPALQALVAAGEAAQAVRRRVAFEIGLSLFAGAARDACLREPADVARSALCSGLGVNGGFQGAA